MVAKILLFVLLGTALTFASPIPEEVQNDLVVATTEAIVKEIESKSSEEINVTDVSVTEQPLETTTKKSKFAAFKKLKALALSKIESVKNISTKFVTKWKKMLNRGEELYANVLDLFQEVKDTFYGPEVKELISTVKTTYIEFKNTGVEAYDEVKSTLKEVEERVNDVKSKISKLGKK